MHIGKNRLVDKHYMLMTEYPRANQYLKIRLLTGDKTQSTPSKYLQLPKLKKKRLKVYVLHFHK